MEKEDTGLIKEMYLGFKAQISERLSSPLMPSFIISWLIVNYKLIVIIFSEGGYEKKFLYIDTQLYASCSFSLLHGLLIPLTCTLLYLFAYPYPAKWVYEFTLKRRRELREVRMQAEKETLLTKEESNNIRVKIHDLRKEIEKQNHDHEEEITTLQAKIDALENKTPIVDDSNRTDGLELSNRSEVKLTDLQAKLLGALSYAEINNILNNDDIKLSKALEINMTEVRLVIGDMLNEKYISKDWGEDGFGNGTNVYQLTHEGRKALKAYVEVATGNIKAF